MNDGKKRSGKTPGDNSRLYGIFSEIVALTDSFCREHLNEEYRGLCGRMAEELASLRPSPLLRGKAATWACGIVRTVGWVNFLDDRSQSPHRKLTEIDKIFGVAESTGQGKSKSIRKMLGIRQFDHRWTLPSRIDDIPMIWMLQDSDGLIFDVRTQPLELQRQAFCQGLIPYVPADRVAAEVRERNEASPSRKLFQFKVTLKGIKPPVWRRIQVQDGTLDQLHEHLQMSMGWGNCHLHEFIIDGQRCGDPELLDDGFETFEGVDSTRTLLSDLIPEGRDSFKFKYIYDFGDDWMHEVLFEGCPEPRSGEVYPQCLEGKRACPPEDVGGVYGYVEYLEAISDPNHERHQELREWRSSHDPNAFSPQNATHAMQEGMPQWRKRKHSE